MRVGHCHCLGLLGGIESFIIGMFKVVFLLKHEYIFIVFGFLFVMCVESFDLHKKDLFLRLPHTLNIFGPLPLTTVAASPYYEVPLKLSVSMVEAFFNSC